MSRIFKSSSYFLRVVLRPASYLRVRQGERPLFFSDKALVDLWGPLIFSFFIIILFYMTGANLPFFESERGILIQFKQFFGFMAGFFIASLAAVATFDKSEMDKFIEGEGASVEIRKGGKLTTHQLTRRRFLCFLFGYLSWLSICLFIACLIIPYAQPSLNNAFKFNSVIKPYCDGTLITLACFVILHYISVTFYGLYYLVDRMHHDSASRAGTPKND